jgi:hypothetical protein
VGAAKASVFGVEWGSSAKVMTMDRVGVSASGERRIRLVLFRQ